MQVRRDLAVELDGAAQFELLADDRGERLDGLVDGLAVLERLGAQRVDVVGRRRHEVRHDVVGEGLELLVLGDEVGLGGELDHRGAVAVGVDRGDQAVGRVAVAALDVLGLALDPQDLDGALEIAVGLLEGLLAVHHPGAGGVAELLHVCGGKVRHRLVLSSSRRRRRVVVAGRRAGRDGRVSRSPVPPERRGGWCWVRDGQDAGAAVPSAAWSAGWAAASPGWASSVG